MGNAQILVDAEEEGTLAKNADVGVALAIRPDVLADCLEAVVHVGFAARDLHVTSGALGLASECNIVSSLAAHRASVC